MVALAMMFLHLLEVQHSLNLVAAVVVLLVELTELVVPVWVVLEVALVVADQQQPILHLAVVVAGAVGDLVEVVLLTSDGRYNDLSFKNT